MDYKDEQQQKQNSSTKVYYHLDDSMPYMSEIPVPADQLTLGDFKMNFARKGYSYFYKEWDPDLKQEVKVEITHDRQLLQKSANGLIELFLLSQNSVDQRGAGNLPKAKIGSKEAKGNVLMAKENRPTRVFPNKRTSTHTQYHESKMLFNEQDNNNLTEESQNRLFGDSNFASSLSDEDSQYTTDFTSVSQQNPQHQFAGRYGMGGGGDHHHHHHNQMTSSNRRYDGNNKPYWTREKRKRYRRSPPSSFLSSTFEDTEVSMAVDLITVTFNMDTRRQFGMSVVVKKNHTFYGIMVHEITPNSLVALDGRIKPGYILLEVNGIPLDEYDTPEESVTILSNAVRNAIENRGQLKLTCVRSEIPRPMQTFFRPPMAEPVRPIDPTAWVQHTNAARGLNMEEYPTDFQFSTALFMNVPKSATLPKIGAGMRFQQLKGEETKQACDQSTSPMKRSTGLKIIQNPSTEITTTSNHSSLECSIGHQQQQDEKIEQDRQPKSSGNCNGGDGQRHGRIGSAIRRLMCILTNKKGKTTSRKRKANSTKRSGKK